jgi:hypothetical protein
VNSRHLSFALTLTLGALACGGAQPAPAAPAAGDQAQSAEGESSTGSSTESSEKAAVSAAESWLALVDAAKYAESWDAAATPFKAAVKQSDWAAMAAPVREPLGQLVARRLRSAEYKTSVPGAPEGKYVIIVFDTDFEKKPQAVETVTPMQDADGSWKVSGYFIK